MGKVLNQVCDWTDALTPQGFWGPCTFAHMSKTMITRLPMDAKCGKVTCCGLWVQRSNPGCYSPFEQSSRGLRSREARLPPINGWQARDKRLAAYASLYTRG